MTNKLTDSEIVKAFRVCCIKLNGNFCDECQYNNKGMCNDVQMATDILDIINRLKADNERLKVKNSELEYDLSLSRQEREGVVKAEAYKEFAERLKEHLCSYDLPDYHSFVAVDVEDIDNLLKELVGDDNDNGAKNQRVAKG